MFLATTADKNFLKPAKEIPLLGNWCNIYDDQTLGQYSKIKIADYHWKDKEVFFKDYRYLFKVYVEMFESIM